MDQVAIVSPPVRHSILPRKGVLRVQGLGVFFALGSFVWGYNIGILATIYVAPGFIKTLNKPTAEQQGLMTAIYYLGTWISYVFLSGLASDRLGRRYAALVGTIVSSVGAAIQMGSSGGAAFVMMIIGRIVSGFGNAIISTSVPLYQSEISLAARRGSLVVMNHIGFILGLSSAFWVGYGLSFWSAGKGFDLSWRLSIAVQFIPATIFVAGLPFVPDTPRWLLEKDRLPEAEKSLQFLRGCEHDPQAVVPELRIIQEHVEVHKASSDTSWRVLFTDRDLFARLWRVALLQFMAQMCGSTAMKYYLPANFLALGLGKQLSLLASGIESSLKVGCTIIEMLIIDRIGRRTSLIVGSAVMSLALLINGVLPQIYPDNANRAADYACVVFIFFFSFGYSVGFGPNAWVYGTEIFPTYVRARGVNFSASAGAIGSIVVAQIWPVAFQRIGSKTYFIFMAINVASIVVLALLYPETKGLTLEEMDNLFGKLSQDIEGHEHIRRPAQWNTGQGALIENEEVVLNLGKM